MQGGGAAEEQVGGVGWALQLFPDVFRACLTSGRTNVYLRERARVFRSAQRELAAAASASLMASPADVPSVLTNHRGPAHQEHYNPRFASRVHVYHEREHRFSLFAAAAGFRK